MKEQVKFFALNIGQARREEAVPETKWDVRSPGLKKLIGNPDIIALIELRDLETSKETARQFLSDPVFHGWDVEHRRYCHFGLTFQMALLFKPGRFFVRDVRFISLGDNPQTSKAIMFVDLQSKMSGKTITIGVTHFDLPEQIKWDSIAILEPLIQNQPHPCMVYGDYNFFNDEQGIPQREKMLEHCDDLAHPLFSDNGEMLSGTFLGFTHDAQKKPFNAMSRLDHIFTPKGDRGIKKIGDAVSPSFSQYLHDNSDYSTYNYPSDHLAISIIFEF